MFGDITDGTEGGGKRESFNIIEKYLKSHGKAWIDCRACYGYIWKFLKVIGRKSNRELDRQFRETVYMG